MKENEIESYEIENDIRYDEEFRSFLKKVLGVLWALCIVGIFVGGDLEGGGGILTPFAYLAFFPIVIIPIWLIFGRWKFLAISLIFFLFLFCMSLVFGIQYKALRNSQEIGSFIAFLSLIGIAGTLLIALIRAVWSLIKKRS